jgi:inorganic pyrophosphatase
MSLDRVPSGAHLPDDFNVIIEIPAHSDPIKYEVDKASGALFVDRFINTAMHYPCNYGYIPHTISDDGDPVDVLVITPFALSPGVVVRCRPLGLLRMEDEAGGDSKLLAVPVERCLPWYAHWRRYEDVGPHRLSQIQHFFEHYKDLEPGKWVKVIGWEDIASAHREILAGVAAYNQASPKPAF